MSAALAHARRVLSGEAAWLVGGVLRDRGLGRATDDLDLIVAGDVRGAARALARAGDAVAFELSDAFGAWRVVARSHAWQIDLTPLRGERLEDDLRLRDLTVNAIAEPLAGGDPVDPSGGLADLAQRRLRMVTPAAFADDPLRTLRLVRLACELELEPDAATLDAARAQAPGLSGVAAERVFAELRRILDAPGAGRGLELAEALGLLRVVLPELEALRGVAQNRYHHLDVHDHSLAVLDEVIALQRDPAGALSPRHGPALSALLAQPLADSLTRGGALRWAALLHDVAKPATRALNGEGRVIFPGHDLQGAHAVRAVLGRLRASERLQAQVAAITRHHLRLGFLVHRRPLTPRLVYGYLHACEPVEVDVTLLSVADRRATHGPHTDAAIAAHVALAVEVLGPALDWRAQGHVAPLVRGDRLGSELGLAPGPELGALLEELAQARYAGEIATPEQAIEHARAVLAPPDSG